MRTFSDILERLRHYYGPPAAPPAHGPFELVLWENACYLLPDERRREVFQALREKVGLNAAAIDAAPDRVLLPIALRGGMRPEMRVFRWREIARITLDQYNGHLDSILGPALRRSQKGTQAVSHHWRPGRRKDPAPVRHFRGTSPRIERPSRFVPTGLGPRTEKLPGDVSLRAGSAQARTSH